MLLMYSRFFAALGALFLFVSPLAADVPTEIDPTLAAIKHDQAAFATLVNHIRDAARSGAWQRDGWTDSTIETVINDWANQSTQLTGQPRPNPPAALAGLRAAQPNGGRLSRSLYVVSGDTTLSFVDKS